MDAELAAIAIEHGVALYTTDRDFGRFAGLRVVNPLPQARRLVGVSEPTARYLLKEPIGTFTRIQLFDGQFETTRSSAAGEFQ